MALNQVFLQGRLTRDVEVRTTESGVAIGNFSLAVERDHKPASGERETDFINCTAFRNTANFISTYFKKGSLICVQGALQTRKYTDKDGNNRVATEVIVDRCYFTGERRQDGDSIPGGQAMRYNESRAATPTRRATSSPAPTAFIPDGDDSDVPF